MAKAGDNLLTKSFSGTIGRLLTFRQIGCETFVSKYQRPPVIAIPTEKMTAARTKFALATIYAKKVIQDPAFKALYQAAAKGGQRAFNIAIMDALHAPNVESIQADNYHGGTAEHIIVTATDDFKVASVTISIWNASGDLVEQGKAVVQENNLDWLYITINKNSVLTGSKVTAIATDLPGNSHSLSISL